MIIPRAAPHPQTHPPHFLTMMMILITVPTMATVPLSKLASLIRNTTTVETRRIVARILRTNPRHHPLPHLVVTEPPNPRRIKTSMVVAAMLKGPLLSILHPIVKLEKKMKRRRTVYPRATRILLANMS